MAKADLRKAETDWRQAIGQAIARAVAAQGWSLKEFAARVAKDERQVARWCDGSERPQFDVLFADGTLRVALVVSLASMAGEDVAIKTVVEIRRTA